MERGSRRAPGTAAEGPEFVSVPLDRRRFLIVLGGAAVDFALAPHVAWAGPQRSRPAPPALQSWQLPDELPAARLDASRALIGAAILAPSYWNSQPWRFEVDENELRLTLDVSRAMPACDPDQRFAAMSIGAALENLLVACRAWGCRPNVKYLPWGAAARRGATQVMASVSWEPGEPHRDRGLFAAILARRSNPRRFDGRAVTLQQRAQLLALVPEEFNLRWLDDRAQVRAVAALAGEAIEAGAGDARARAERYRWLRFSDGDERRAGDGVTPEHMSLVGPLGWLAARALHPRSRAHAWATGSLAHEATSAIRSTGSLALLTVSQSSEATPLLAGQAYERIALQATAMGLAQQPLASPLESPAHRAAIARRFGAAPGEEPLLLVRIGHARAVTPSMRRAVALVSTWHVA